MTSNIETFKKARLIWPEVINSSFLIRFIADGTLTEEEAKIVMEGKT